MKLAGNVLIEDDEAEEGEEERVVKNFTDWKTELQKIKRRDYLPRFVPLLGLLRR